MLGTTLLGILVPIIVGLALVSAFKSAGKIVAADKKGITNLRMNKMYGILGVVSLILFFVCSLLMIDDASGNVSGIIPFIILFALFLLLPAIVCSLWYLNHKVSYDKKSITVSNSFGRKSTIEFQDIESTDMDYMTGMLKVKTKRDSVNIHQHLVGVKLLTLRIKQWIV